VRGTGIGGLLLLKKTLLFGAGPSRKDQRPVKHTIGGNRASVREGELSPKVVGKGRLGKGEMPRGKKETQKKLQRERGGSHSFRSQEGALADLLTMKGSPCDTPEG